MTEWAIVKHGEIVNVVTTRQREDADRTAKEYGDEARAVLLETLPLSVRERYRYWNERP